MNFPLTSLRRCRCEGVRHCKWADEVIPEAPWILTPEFLLKYEIDYVAHDEDPYAAVGHDDVYNLVKREGLLRIYNMYLFLTSTARQVPAHKAHSWNLYHGPSLSNGVTVSIWRFQFQAKEGRKRRTELEWHIILTSAGDLPASRTAIEAGGCEILRKITRKPRHHPCFLNSA